MALPRGKNVADALLVQTKALPAAAGAVYTTAFDVMNGANGSYNGAELYLEAPALTATELPNTRTMTYALQDSADNSSFADVQGYEQIALQTGAGSAVAAETSRVALPSTIQRYVRVRATGGTSIGDCSGKSLTATLKF